MERNLGDVLNSLERARRTRKKLEDGSYWLEEEEEEDEEEEEEVEVRVDNSNRDLLYDDEGIYDRSYVEELRRLKATDYVTDEQMAKDLRIAGLLNLIIDEAIELRTTDIQVSIPRQDVVVRYRINGKMEDYRFIEREAFEAISCRVKYLGGLDISEAKVPLDGRFTHLSGEIPYDIRVSTIPTNKGENISLRLLYNSDLDNNLSSLHIRENVLEKYRKATMAREGLILLTGPTGSGKTTTLYTTIGELMVKYNNEKNIMTIEDPIEYALDGISQSQVNLVRDYDFGDGLRAILRQNPDIILIGEIRDRITAETAVRASNTGHLVFSTLHASDAVSTAIVMKQLGVEPYNISNSLRIVLNQRLIGKLCDYCKEAIYLSDRDKGWFPELERAYESGGCSECSYTGKKGLVLVIEMLEVTERFRELIFRNVTSSEMKELLKGDESYYSLHEDLLNHLREGNISVGDAIHLS